MPVKKVYENDNGELVKKCNKCKIIQPIDNFYKKKMFIKILQDYKYYPVSKCKLCMKIEYLEKCKDKVYKYNKIPMIPV